MANLSSNPWSFTSADVATAAITSLTLNSDGTVTAVTAALTFNTNGVEPALGFTVNNASLAAYNGFYKLIVGVSGGTTFTLAPQFSIPAGTGAAGAQGNLSQCLYRAQIRIEDMSIQGLTGAVAANVDLRDRSGNILWQANVAVGQQNRGKVFWVNGFTPLIIPSNTVVLVTVN